MATTIIHPKTKQFDLPPRGDRNPDPITDSPGAHPIETGIGAALTGTATGLIGGAVAGPVGAVIGAVAGAVGGGYAGKGIGEAIDPTQELTWYNDYKDYVETADERAYSFGIASGHRHHGRLFSTVESDVKLEWAKEHPSVNWAGVRNDIQAGYERTIQFRQNAIRGM